MANITFLLVQLPDVSWGLHDAELSRAKQLLDGEKQYGSQGLPGLIGCHARRSCHA